MRKNHTVVQGEYLAKIARAYGFASYQTIWDAPENKDLKDKRKNPNVLFPGDELFIPDKEIKQESRATEKRHKFELASEPLKLRIVLMDLNKKLLEGHKCTLIVENDAAEFTTKSDGQLEQEISGRATTGTLLDRGKPDDKLSTQREFPLKIGHLDPVAEVAGQMARLNNLGYDAGDPTAPLGKPEQEDERYQQFLSAIEEFQCDFDLKVDGICGRKTQ